jgi:membrane-bound metal-dependent hydrolase YbcI (DUF457 family)
MLLRTHLAISLFFALLLFPFVNSKFIFFGMVFIATLLPDIDSRFSRIGQKKLARVLQFFTKHRGIIHSFTLLFILTLVLVLFFPVISLGFFLGYSLHLFSDSFTKDGIFPFYPLRIHWGGMIKTGGKSEVSVLVLFIFLDVLLILSYIF